MISVWLTKATQCLQVMSTFSVETLHSDPFDYIVTDPSFHTLPVSYTGDVALSVAPYRTGSVAPDAVRQFAHAVATDASYETLSFPTQLNARVHTEVVSVVREHGALQPAELTLAERQRACRNLAVPFIEAYGVLGLAARFVSGYRASEAHQKSYTHAWAEVCVLGGGWRDYDPTVGLAVGDRHVAVTADRIAQLTAPITEAFVALQLRLLCTSICRCAMQPPPYKSKE